jgi:hypothetical protein
LNPWIDLKGASGATYRYTLAENAKPRSPVSGTFVFVKQAKPAPRVIYAAEAMNLSEVAPELWPQAVKEFGATHLFTRLNVARAAREAELSDILAAEQPPMNSDAPSPS